MKTNKKSLNVLIGQMESLTETEKGHLSGGVSSFQVKSEEKASDTNYFQCGCNNYQCKTTPVQK